MYVEAGGRAKDVCPPAFFLIARAAVRLAAIPLGSFLRKDNSLPDFDNNASSLKLGPVAALARRPAGYKQVGRQELQRPARLVHIHNWIHTPPEDNCTQVDKKVRAHKSPDRNPAGLAPNRSRFPCPSPQLRHGGGDVHGDDGAHDDCDDDGRDHARAPHAPRVLCQPRQDSAELRRAA